jgi:CubicO group peptidase (beta-lactamase class C family)
MWTLLNGYLCARLKGSFLIPFVILVLTGCAGSMPDSYDWSALDTSILKFMESDNIPSISAVVVKKGEVIYQRSAGWADREKQIKATPSTMYDLASISKVFTVTGLMILQERGLIDLDAPVELYLSGTVLKTFGFEPDEVTVRRTIQHTSGLPMYWENFTEDEISEMPAIREILNRYAMVAFEPGKHSIYSNIGHAVLQALIEDVSGLPYADFMEQEVFEPLNLSGTSVYSVPPDLDSIAKPYDVDGQKFLLKNTPIAPVYSSALDLARFGIFHLPNDHGPNPILSSETVRKMQSNPSPVSGYCLPWMVRTVNGYRTLSFTGASGTVITLVPEENLVVVVLANRFLANTLKIRDQILSRMLPEIVRRTPADWFRGLFPTRLEAASRPEVALEGTWVGSITTPDNSLEIQFRFDTTNGARIKFRTQKKWINPMDSNPGKFDDGVFSAYFPLEIPGESTARHHHWAWVYWSLNHNLLRGYTVAHATEGPYFGLPFYTELTKEGS